MGKPTIFPKESKISPTLFQFTPLMKELMLDLHERLCIKENLAVYEETFLKESPENAA